MTDILVRSGTLLTMDPALGEVAQGELLIRGGRIAAIGTDLTAGHAEILDLGGMIVMPGLVNAHLHTWQTALRGIAGDWSLAEYGRNVHAGVATAFRPDDIYIANLVGALGQIANGVTTLFDWSHNNPTPAHSDRAIDALFESGIRAVYGHGTPKPSLDSRNLPTDELLHPESEVRRLRTGRLGDDDGRVTMALCIRGPDLSSLEASAHDIRLARRYGVMASAHVGGRVPQSRKTPNGLEALAQMGLIGPDFNAVHGNKLSDGDIALLADAGASFTTTPEVEMQMGHGLPVTGRVLARGRAPSVGTDVEPAIGGGPLGQARFALQLQRGLDNLASIERTGRDIERVSISARQGLSWAMAEGARALRLEDRIGSLALGRAADLVGLRLDHIDMLPAGAAAEAVLLHAGSGGIDTVMVDGVVLKRDGRLTYPGLDEAKALLAQSRRRLQAALTA